MQRPSNTFGFACSVMLAGAEGHKLPNNASKGRRPQDSGTGLHHVDPLLRRGSLLGRRATHLRKLHQDGGTRHWRMELRKGAAERQERHAGSGLGDLPHDMSDPEAKPDDVSDARAAGEAVERVGQTLGSARGEDEAGGDALSHHDGVRRNVCGSEAG